MDSLMNILTSIDYMNALDKCAFDEDAEDEEETKETDGGD